MNVHSPSGWWRRTTVLAVAATFGVVGVTAPASAAPTAGSAKAAAAASDPSAVVSSDGSTVSVPNARGRSAVTPGATGAGLSAADPADARGAVVTGPAPQRPALDNGNGTGAESIIGADNRYQVNPGAYPGTATVLITFDGGRCSGWMAGYNAANLTSTIVTAGHCVYNLGVGWRTNVAVYPGYNSTGYGCAATTLYSVNGYVSGGSEEYDYGAIKVNCTYSGQPLAYWTGWYGRLWTSGSLLNNAVRTQGYPGDKAINTQWASDGTLNAQTTLQLFYNNDTVGGQSGSAVYLPNYSTCGHCSVAIHAYGLHGSAPHSTNNHGTRITQAVYNNISAWVAA